MKREYLGFLVGGLAFGALFGYALFVAIERRPAAALLADAGAIPSPAGPAAPTQVGGGGQPAAGGGSAPMIAEINALREALQRDPDDLDALLRIGNIYRMAGLWDQADTFFERALQNNADDAQLVGALANVYHDGERWERAVELYQQALGLSPDDPDLLTDMGICYKHLGRFDEALELFRRAHEIDPQHWQSLFNTVVVQGFDLGLRDAAMESLRELERINPDAPELDRLREAIARSQGEAVAGS